MLNKEVGKLKLKDLKLSEDIVTVLHLNGIDTLEDLNGFSLLQLRKYVFREEEEQFEKLVPLLKKYEIPTEVRNLSLSKELTDHLETKNITETYDLINIKREVYAELVLNDEFIAQELSQIFKIYGVNVEELEIHKEPEVDVGEYVRLQKAKTKPRKRGSKEFSHLSIRLASPEEIRMWSYGEVLNHETINYRSLKPEDGGLFCEKIFGPYKDYQCQCGKKRNIEKGQVCDKCGVEITEAKVRRERMGHIELEAPVVHTWYLKNTPSRLALLLDIKAKDLEEVVYLASYIVTNPGAPGETELVKKQILSEMEYSQYFEKYGNRFTAETGAEAVKRLLMDLDLEEEARKIRRKLKSTSKQKRERAIKRLEVVEAFLNSDNKPEWMVLDVLPVIPPDLRPMVALDGGRFATTDLNDLYRRIINRNNRLKKQKEQFVPRLIIKNEKRLLQESVDALIDNAKRGKKANVERNRQLKSLSDMLRGKQGRFRQNLLGKRVDFSARSVIIVGPDLEMYQCGIPREMALTLFKPFVIKELTDHFGNLQEAKRSYDNKDPEAWDALEEIVVEHPVLLNRAPTLHRLGIQAFQPKLIDGKAIRLHPLVTTAFNADFDGDQMAVHVPLSHEAQAEARLLMLGSNNILSPKNGRPVVTPSQDMVLGNYYLTMSKKGLKNEGSFYISMDEAYLAYKNGEIELHTLIILNPNSINKKFSESQKDKYLITTLGKLIFNDILPGSFPYLNEPTRDNLVGYTDDRFFFEKGTDARKAIKKLENPDPFGVKYLSQVIAEVFKQFEINETSKILDKLKDLGFKYSTVSGITVSHSDMQVYSGKAARVKETEERVAALEENYEDGLLTDEERYRLVIQEWEKAGEDIQKGVMGDFEYDNHIYMMFHSGARANPSNFAQMLGMRGLMRNPTGEIIEVPVKASFKEGLTVSEFFISTHGARKGSTDTALKTAESGYLTRRLVDVAQDVIVDAEDCGTDKTVLVEPLYSVEKDEVKETIPLYDRIVGRFAGEPVFHPKTGEMLVDRDELITNEIAEEITNLGIKAVRIRSVFTCNSYTGVCMKCYGRNLATNKIVEMGEAVGVIAAQSIGEPGTQLTMRTFHTGGVASSTDITAGLPRVQELFEARKPKGKATIVEERSKVKKIENKAHEIIVTITELGKEEAKEKKITLDPNSQLLVKEGDILKPGDRINKGSIDPKELLRATDVRTVEKYLLEEIQKVYRITGEEISDKHIEIIIRQMLKKVRIIYEAETDLLPGSEVSIRDFYEANEAAIKEGKRPAIGQTILLGIAKAALQSESFLSAASFQETTRVLTDAAVHGKSDELHGLKENVIIGGLIPAGTGILKEKSYTYLGEDLEEEEISEEGSF